MSAPLSPGNIVLCRLYNTPDRRFYGPYFKALILEITGESHPYTVTRLDDDHILTLARREIVKRLRQSHTPAAYA